VKEIFKMIGGSGIENESGSSNLVIAPTQMMMPSIEMLIPIFSGSPGENCNAFLKNFKEVANEFKWSEGAKLIWLRSRLTGEAKQVYEALTQIDTVSFGKVEEKLIELYGMQENKYASAKLQKIIAEPRESMTTLKFRIENAVTRYLKDSVDLQSETGKNAFDKVAFSQLIEAVGPKYREHIIREGATTFQKAMEIAVREQNMIAEIEKFNEATRSENEENTKFQKLLETKNEEIRELKESINALKYQPQNRDRKREQKQIICFFCNKPGHKRTECRWLQGDGYPNNRTGNNRGKIENNYKSVERNNAQWGNKNTASKYQQKNFLG
jgi:hypothetical protein